MVSTLLVVFGILCNLAIGFIVLLQDYRSKLNRSLVGLSLSLCFWQVANYFADQTTSLTLFWNKAAFIGPIFAFFFAGLFISKLVWPTKLTMRQYFIFASCVIFSTYALTGQVIGAVSAREVAGIIVGYDVDRSAGYYVLLAWILYLLVDFLVIITGAYRNATGKLREQLSVILLGVGGSLLVGVFTNLLIPLATGSTAAAQYAPLASILIMATFAFAIARHGLLDIRFFVVRAATYLITTLGLSLLYIAPLLAVMIYILGFPFVLPKFLAALVVASLAAYFYQSLRNRFDTLTARVFYRNGYDSELFIGQLNKAVVTNLDLGNMLNSAAGIITRNIKADYCLFIIHAQDGSAPRYFGIDGQRRDLRSLESAAGMFADVADDMVVTEYMRDTHKEFYTSLRKAEISVIGRLVSKADESISTTSTLILGQKKNGELYNKRDIRILSTIVDGLTVAIQNALRFEEIQNFNITLQQRVEERTRQLQRSNEKLKALDESKDDFISMASHQLRTPLTAVKGYLSMVLDGDSGKITPLQKKMLAQAFMSSQHMVYLIADLLNVSRLKTGKFVIEPVPLNLANLIQEEIGQLKETAKSRSLQLNFVKPKNFPTLMLDETKTRQVVMNFIDNALHYTPSGGHVTVELTELAHSVELHVRDDGIGVPKAEQPHLFTKFYRAINARRERPDGTGLGLFMAKKVVLAQGGAVLFESKENHGSLFGFTLPKQKLLPKDQQS